MPKNTTAAIYQPLTPGGLFIIHKKLFQKSGITLATLAYAQEKNHEKWHHFGNTSLPTLSKSITYKNAEFYFL